MHGKFCKYLGYYCFCRQNPSLLFLTEYFTHILWYNSVKRNENNIMRQFRTVSGFYLGRRFISQRNNPVKYTDPDGRIWFCKDFAGADFKLEEYMHVIKKVLFMIFLLCSFYVFPYDYPWAVEYEIKKDSLEEINQIIQNYINIKPEFHVYDLDLDQKRISMNDSNNVYYK